MHRAGSSVLGALLLAVVQVAAAEDSAPLEATKKELQQLQSAQKTKAGVTPTEGLKIATPTMEVSGESASFDQQWLANKTKEDRKREQQGKNTENWLVNGVEKLGQKHAKGSGKTPATTADQDSTAEERAAAPLDTSDPQYLLKLFDDQQKRPDGKQLDAKSHATPVPDPFAPFLQSWLGTSPVRDQVLDQYTRKDEAGGSTPMPAAVLDYHTAGASPVTVVAGRQTLDAEKPNPYLIELNSPIPTKDLTASTNSTPTRDVSGLSPEAAKTPATMAPLDPLPDVRTPAKGPPPGPADDKKYFPQLKKF